MPNTSIPDSVDGRSLAAPESELPDVYKGWQPYPNTLAEIANEERHGWTLEAVIFDDLFGRAVHSRLQAQYGSDNVTVRNLDGTKDDQPTAAFLYFVKVQS